MRTIKHSAVAAAVVLTGGMAAGCGGGDDTDTPTTAVSTPVVTVTPSATTSAAATDTTAPEKTATPAKTATSSATPVPTQTNGLPKNKPEPGPPEQFTVTILPKTLKADTKTVLQNKDMKAQLVNKAGENALINVTGPQGFGLGSGAIQKGDKAPVYLRSLAAGSKITFTSPGRRKLVVKVVAG